LIDWGSSVQARANGKRKRRNQPKTRKATAAGIFVLAGFFSANRLCFNSSASIFFLPHPVTNIVELHCQTTTLAAPILGQTIKHIHHFD
jgi:hypothetical protein